MLIRSRMEIWWVLAALLAMFACSANEASVNSGDNELADQPSEFDETPAQDGDAADRDPVVPDGDTETPEFELDTGCDPDTYRCNGSLVERCSPMTSDWEFYLDCNEREMQCAGGQCVSADAEVGDCTPMEKRCVENTIQRCSMTGTVWEEYMTCPAGDVCLDGECIYPRGDECTADTEFDVCSDGEYCLLPNDGTDVGFCAPYCDLVDNRCPRAYTCSGGRCAPIVGYCRSDAECATDEFCNKLPTQDDGSCKKFCFEAGEFCAELYKCVKEPTDLNYGHCIPKNTDCSECSSDGACASGNYCEILTGFSKGCCHAYCNDLTNPCPTGYNCGPDGRCVYGNGCDECPGGCPKGHICEKNYCMCVLNCPSCPEGQCCDADSAPNCYDCGECQNPAVCGILLPPCCFGYNCSAVVYGVLGYCI